MSQRLHDLVFQCKDPALGGTDRLVLLTIAYIIREEEDGSGSLWAKKETLAYECQVSPRTIVTSCARLVELGFLVELERLPARPVRYAINEARLGCHLRKERAANSADQPCKKFSPANSSALQELQTSPASSADLPCNICSPTLQDLQTYQEDYLELDLETTRESARADEDVENPVEEPPLAEWEVLPGLVYPEALRTPEFRNLWQMWVRYRADDGRALNIWSQSQKLNELAREGIDRACVIVSKAISNGFKQLRHEVADEVEAKPKAVPSDPAALREEAEQIMRQSVDGEVPEINLALLEGYGRMQDYRLSQFGKQPRTASDLVAEIGRYRDVWGDLPASVVAETADWFSRSGKPFPPPGPFAEKGRELWAKSRPAFTVTPVPTEYERKRQERRTPGSRMGIDPQALASAKRMPEGV